MWKPITALYEWTLSIEFTVVLAFWLVEIPAMGLRGDFYKLDWINWAALVYNHTIPILVCFTEWRVSSIPIGWARYPFYISVGIVYLVAMVVWERALNLAPVYAAFDWNNSPGNSSLLAGLVLLQQAFAFGLLKLFSDRKLDPSALPPGYEDSEPWGADVEAGEVVIETWKANIVHTTLLGTRPKAQNRDNVL